MTTSRTSTPTSTSTKRNWKLWPRPLMRVLGIDCGTEKTGYGLIESDGRSHRMIAAGCISTSPKNPLHERLLSIARGLREVIELHAPEAAAVEEVFYAQNVKTALKLSHARGVVLLAIAEAGIALGRVLPARDQDQRGRLWPRRETAGENDGAFLAAARRRRDRIRRRLRRPCRRHLPRNPWSRRPCVACCSSAPRSPSTPSPSSPIRNISKAAPPKTQIITVNKSGEAVYKESVTDDQPLKFQLTGNETSEIFALADKLGRFDHPIESGLKVANMGQKTFRFEDGAVKNEVKFNYSQDLDAQALLDWFERISESEQRYIDLDRAVHFDKLGVNQSVLELQVVWERKRLVAPAAVSALARSHR